MPPQNQNSAEDNNPASNPTFQQSITYTPPVQSPDLPQPKPKKYKKLILVIGFILLTIVAATGILYKLGLSDTNQPVTSPLGYLKGFDDVSSGRVNIKADYLSTIDGSYDFYVRNDGRVFIDMLPDTHKANGFLDVLAQRTDSEASQKLDSSALSAYHATRYMEIDLKSLYGYSRVESTYPADLFGLYLPLLADGTGIPSDAEDTGLKASKSSSCTNSAKQLQVLLGPRYFNTANFKLVKTNTENIYSIDTKNKQKVNDQTEDFINQCFLAVSSSKKADSDFFDQNYGDLFKKNKQKALNLKLENNTLVINADRSGNSSPLTLSFSSETPKRALAQNPKASSLFNTQNLFALAYAKCRNAPVMASDFTRNYVFDSGSTEYMVPSSFDSRYYCTTSEAEKDNFSFFSFDDGLKYQVGSSSFSISGAGIIQQKSVHDIGYHLEDFFVNHGYYPGLEELANTTSEELKPLGVLKDINGKTLNKGEIKYEPSPKNCSKCKGYKLSSNYYYQPTNNPIALTKTDYEHTK